MGRLLLRDENTNWPRGQEFETIQTGNVFYVDSNTGADTNLADGSQTNPFATVDYAIGKCTANNGDVIIEFPGSAQTVSAAGTITFDVAGVTYIGLSNGDARPTWTFGTVVGASVLVSAANVTIKGCLGVAGLDSLTNPFNIQAADCTLDIEWEDPTDAIEAVRAVLTNASADNFKCKLRYRGRTGGNACVNAVRLVGCNGGRIDVDFYGKASTSIVEFLTTACSDIEVAGSFYNSGTTDLTKNVVDTVTGSTWWVKGFDGAAGGGFSGGSGQAIASDDVSTIAGYHTVATADTSTNAVMRDVIGNKSDAAVYTVDTSTSEVAYLKGLVNLTDQLDINRDTVIAVSADLSSATWNSVASHEIATVSGLNRVRIIPYCTVNLVGGANAGSGTMALGDASSASRLITATTASTIDADETWVTSSTGHEKTVNLSSIFDLVVNDQDIGYTVGTSALTAGTMIFVIASEPLEANASVSAGAGGSL